MAVVWWLWWWWCLCGSLVAWCNCVTAGPQSAVKRGGAHNTPFAIARVRASSPPGSSKQAAHLHHHDNRQNRPIPFSAVVMLPAAARSRFSSAAAAAAVAVQPTRSCGVAVAGVQLSLWPVQLQHHNHLIHQHHLQQQQQHRHGAMDRSCATRAQAAASGYWTLAEACTLEVEVKKSRFITTAWPVTTAAEALSHISAASDPSASHNCWAFKVAGSARSNDDGEPGGTAGKPILGAIEGDGIDGVAVLVVRHFGGIKLGAGGLVRAYGGAARDCLRAAPKLFVRSQVQLLVDASFDCLGTVYGLLPKFGAVAAGQEQYTDGGRVQLAIAVDADSAAELQAAIVNASSGRVSMRQQQQEPGDGS